MPRITKLQVQDAETNYADAKKNFGPGHSNATIALGTYRDLRTAWELENGRKWKSKEAE